MEGCWAGKSSFVAFIIKIVSGVNHRWMPPVVDNSGGREMSHLLRACTAHGEDQTEFSTHVR